jgi:hypothetical protein
MRGAVLTCARAAEHREPLGFRIESGVDIPVMHRATGRTGPLPDREREGSRARGHRPNSASNWGSERLTATRVLPYQLALYSSWRSSSPQPTSAMAQAAAVILQHVFDAERLDTDHASSGQMSLVVSLCWKSRRRSAMRAWMRAILRRAFSWFLLPFCFLACRRWARARRCSSCWKKRSLPVFSPVERVTTSYSPRSIPTVVGEMGNVGHQEGDKVPSGGITADRDSAGFGVPGQGATRAEWAALPAGTPAAGCCHPRRRQRRVYSADCRSRFFLNCEYFARPPKKLRNASSRCRRAGSGRDTGDLIQPVMRWILFESGQRHAGVLVEAVFPQLSIGLREQGQTPVVHETRTTDRCGPASGAGSASGSSDSGRPVSVP